MLEINGKPYAKGFMQVSFKAGTRLKELGVQLKEKDGRYHDSFFFESWEQAGEFNYIPGGPRTPARLLLVGE